MNYFEFYGIPETLTADARLVKQQYFAKSKQYHPDFHVNEPAEKQAEILELSTLNTKAYQTLSQPDRLIRYVLVERGLLDETKQPALPADFLMEMMDLNEAIDEARQTESEEMLHQATQQVTQLEQELGRQIAPVLEQYLHTPEAEKPALLQQVKDYYLKMRYLLRLRESLGKIAAPNSRI